MFAGKKKKAKKIPINTGDGGQSATGADETLVDEGDSLDFSNLKKKKKRRDIDSGVAAFDSKLEEAGVVDEKEADVKGGDLFEKGEADNEATVGGEKDEEEAWLKSDRDYTYEEVCRSFFHFTFVRHSPF